ncbi:MAG TPA: radical SAM protein [Anaeromyxobacteraceae bacterium]|nr:radical SAM protein [Anaeromyxobacteraceae bacterium]
MHSALWHARSLFLKTRPVHLTFFVTRRCNLRCPFCFYQEARDAPGDAPELSAEEVRRVAASLGRLLWVAFSGGEPFLRDDLAELAGIFHDANRVAFFTLPTNGLLTEVVAERTQEILDRCRNSVVVVKLSLDGVGQAHDAIRRAPGAFEKAMRTCERLAALAERHPRLELGVNTLFCSENQGRMDEIIEFVHGLGGVRSHTLTMVRGNLREARYGRVDLCGYREAIRHLESRWRSGAHRRPRFGGARLKAAQDRLQKRLIHRTLSEHRRVAPCYAGRLSLVLSEGGDVRACEERPGESFGNVRDAGYDMGRLLRTGWAERIRGDIAAGGCHCSHECNLLTNILFNPAMQPKLLWECARS